MGTGNTEELLEKCKTECFHYLTDSSTPDGKAPCFSAESLESGQKVASFSFYGKLKSAYYNGIKDNLETIDTFYPGWRMRVYLNPAKLPVDSSTDLCDLTCQSARLDLCSAEHSELFGDVSGKFGMVWRFLPLADPRVDVMISRDLDSRFSERETAAVHDWLDSELPFHSMRDNPHHGVPILGGMWGARMDLGNRAKYSDLIGKMLSKMSKSWGKGYDQTLLTQYVWPGVKDEAVVHDSYLCNHFPAKHNRPWPTRRKNETGNFVGSIGDMKIAAVCPVECRPAEHQDWTFC